MDPRHFSGSGVLAIEPSALGLAYAGSPVRDEVHVEGNVAIVCVSGPLAYAADSFFDSYPAIRARFACALESPARTILLHLATPGGDVAGVFDLADWMRESAAAAGKRIVAYTDQTCASAGYALACAADEISASQTATIGSIGVLAVLRSEAAALGAVGIDAAVITSGARKADGNPLLPITDAARAAAQASVDALAGVFFEHVRTRRAALLAPEALEGGVRIGAQALADNLIDRVESFDALVTRLNAPPNLVSDNPAPLGASEETVMNEQEKAALYAALKAAAEKGDEKAKRALAAYEKDEAEAEHEEPDGDEPKKDDEEKKAMAALAAQVASLSADLAAERAAKAALAKAESEAKAMRERAEFMAANPHVPAALAKTLEPLPFERVKEIVAAIPKPAGVASATAEHQAAARAISGAAVGGVTSLSPEAAELDRKFGLAYEEPVPLAKHEGTSQVFSAAALAPANRARLNAAQGK